MAIHLKTDSAKSHQRSQPDAEHSFAGLRGVRLTRLQARERMKTSTIFLLGTQLKHQRKGSRRALPSQSLGTPKIRAHRGGFQKSSEAS